MNNQIKVTYLEHMGSDKTVVNAARASFGKESKGPITEADVSLLNFLARGFTQKEWDALVSELSWEANMERIEELLWKVKTTPTHFAPFTHPQLSIRIEAPLSIARQMWKSHVGLSGGDHGYPGWSESSRIYIDEPPEFSLPDGLRKRADNVKQGSLDELVDRSSELWAYIHNHCENSQALYKYLIDANVAPEQARLVLPNATKVSWVWTGSLSAWARVAGLRSNGHAQKEAQLIAEPLIKILEEHFPYSYSALATGNAVFNGVEPNPAVDMGFSYFREQARAKLGLPISDSGLGMPISEDYYIGEAELRFKLPVADEPIPVDKFTEFFKKLFLLP